MVLFPTQGRGTFPEAIRIKLSLTRETQTYLLLKRGAKKMEWDL